VLIVLKSGSLNFLETSGTVQGCNGIALPFFYFPHLHKNLMLASAQTETLRQTARTHLRSSSSRTRQTGCNVQPLLVHVYKGYRQTRPTNVPYCNPFMYESAFLETFCCTSLFLNTHISNGQVRKGHYKRIPYNFDSSY
jgi:hypothetical protein